MDGPDTLRFLLDLGDATYDIDNPTTGARINEIQRQVGVHEDCSYNGKRIRNLMRDRY